MNGESGDKSRNKSRDKILENIVCSKCNGINLRTSVDRYFTNIYIFCNDCQNTDTRKIYDGKPQELVKCSICGGSTTKIITEGKYQYPDWNYPYLENLDDIEVLCDKCYDEHIEELEEKNAEKNKERVDNRVEELKKELEEDHTTSITLTDMHMNYIVALIENDDDFATETCLDEDIEDDYEFDQTKKVYKNWQDNLLDIFKKAQIGIL